MASATKSASRFSERRNSFPPRMGAFINPIRESEAMTDNPQLNRRELNDLLEKFKVDDEAWVPAISEISEKFKELGKDAAPTLVGALKDPDWRVRFGAVQSLGLIASDAVDDPTGGGG